MDRFVCVRIVQANGLDLSLFQFDYDLTFAVFFMNADRTIYGRYGSRSSMKEASKDISLEGLRKALAAALELHGQYPANRDSLRGKTGPKPRFAVPEQFPSLRGRYKSELDYSGMVVQSCIHCHQVRDAERQVFRAARKPVPDEALFPWPMPDAVGLELDPREKANVERVVAGSPADRAGFRPGDEIVVLEGQPVLSIADVQWVLHNAAASAKLRASVQRGGRRVELTLALDEGWRRKSDLSWRPTTWNLRRMATGGLVLEEIPAEERRGSGRPAASPALRIKHVGQFGAHAVAKRAGFQKGDVIVSFDGRSDLMSESDLLAYALQNRMPGERVSVVVLRNGKRVTLNLPLQ